MGVPRQFGKKLLRRVRLRCDLESFRNGVQCFRIHWDSILVNTWVYTDAEALIAHPGEPTREDRDPSKLRLCGRQPGRLWLRR
jgi:hypothetical protein